MVFIFGGPSFSWYRAELGRNFFFRMTIFVASEAAQVSHKSKRLANSTNLVKFAFYTT